MHALLLVANLVVTNETVVHDTTTNVEITLDDTTVRCSSADYGALFLKVLIPQLSQLTLLDHQNTGAGAPCVASGLCGPGNEPSDLIDPDDATETVAVNVTAIRQDVADSTAQTCETSLIERVHTTIRGIELFHERSAPLGSRPYSDCVTTPQPVTEDPPADHPTPPATDDDPSLTMEPDGGCSASRRSSSPGVLALVGLALVGTRRRRRS